jgi:hypothetical protein
VGNLKKIGRKAVIIKEAMPTKKPDVFGAMTGIASFDFSKYESKILPGAICDNLTSFGGKMSGKRGTGQTTVSEFIAYGAAGASGTVIEPYTVPHKFPHPMIHYHYSQGCSLAESFYQSVYCPYQLLIVGDPLCQPFANFPKFEVSGLSDDQTIDGKLTISMRPSANSPVPIRGYEFFFNGQKVKTLKPDGTINFDSTKVLSGLIEFRIVAIANNRVETRSGQTFNVRVSNGEAVEDISPLRMAYKTTDKLLLNCPDFKNVKWTLMNNSREVAQADGQGKISLDCTSLGLGPVRLRVVASNGSQMSRRQAFIVNISE